MIDKANVDFYPPLMARYRAAILDVRFTEANIARAGINLLPQACLLLCALAEKPGEVVAGLVRATGLKSSEVVHLCKFLVLPLPGKRPPLVAMYRDGYNLPAHYRLTPAGEEMHRHILKELA